MHQVFISLALLCMSFIDGQFVLPILLENYESAHVLNLLNEYRMKRGVCNELVWSRDLEIEAAENVSVCKKTVDARGRSIIMVENINETKSRLEIINSFENFFANCNDDRRMLSADCAQHYQITHPKIERVGCAYAMCYLSPETVFQVGLCNFDKSLNQEKKEFGFNAKNILPPSCYNKQETKPTIRLGSLTTRTKQQLKNDLDKHTLYGYVHKIRKNSVLRTSLDDKESMLKEQYQYKGEMGKIYKNKNAHCQHTSPLLELMSPDKTHRIYTSNGLLGIYYKLKGYTEEKIIGHAIKGENVCTPPAVPVYEFSRYDKWFWYTANVTEVNDIIKTKGGPYQQMYEKVAFYVIA